MRDIFERAEIVQEIFCGKIGFISVVYQSRNNSRTGCMHHFQKRSSGNDMWIIFMQEAHALLYMALTG